jgi:hypothetical protein
MFEYLATFVPEKCPINYRYHQTLAAPEGATNTNRSLTDHVERPNAMASPIVPSPDLTGQRFTKLVVLGWIKDPKNGRMGWLCKCDCETLRMVRTSVLLNGQHRSCGCAQRQHLSESRKKHGMKGTPTYSSWISARKRCRNPKSPDYYLYGGRGIKFCSRWDDFENFLNDMGLRPSMAYSLDRIDVNGDYEPGNCRWATQREQGNNTRCNRLLEFNGKSQSLAQWAREIGISRDTLGKRLESGWSVEKALTTPLKAERTHCDRGHPYPSSSNTPRKCYTCQSDGNRKRKQEQGEARELKVISVLREAV